MKNMKLSELLADNKTVLCDGAFATFYSKLTGNSERRCELENINNPEIVKRIHTQYINAGAKIIRTNTFICLQGNVQAKTLLFVLI